MKRIPISTAKAIRETLGASHVVIFAIGDDGQQHVATHGETRQNAKEAAKAGDKLKTALGWPADLCKSTPLERVCKNCAYWKADWGIRCFNVLIRWMEEAGSITELMEKGAHKIMATPLLSAVQEDVLIHQLCTQAKKRFAYTISATAIRKDIARIKQEIKNQEKPAEKVREKTTNTRRVGQTNALTSP